MTKAEYTRFHGVSVAVSTVHRLLGQHGMNRLPANQKYRPHTTRWTRYEKRQPGTRIRALKVYAACTQRTAIRFVDAVRRRLPFRIRVTSQVSSRDGS